MPWGKRPSGALPPSPGGTLATLSVLLVAVDEALDFHTWHFFTEILSWKNNSAAYSKHSFLPGHGVLSCSSKFKDHRYNHLTLKNFFWWSPVLLKKAGGESSCYCRIRMVSAGKGAGLSQEAEVTTHDGLSPSVGLLCPHAYRGPGGLERPHVPGLRGRVARSSWSTRLSIGSLFLAVVFPSAMACTHYRCSFSVYEMRGPARLPQGLEDWRFWVSAVTGVAAQSGLAAS